MRRTAFGKKVCFYVSKLKKMSDKISRNPTSFVRHLICFKMETGLFSQALFD